MIQKIRLPPALPRWGEWSLRRYNIAANLSSLCCDVVVLYRYLTPACDPSYVYACHEIRCVGAIANLHASVPITYRVPSHSPNRSRTHLELESINKNDTWQQYETTWTKQARLSMSTDATQAILHCNIENNYITQCTWHLWKQRTV